MTDLRPISETEPQVFILESLSLEDEEKERFEGRIIRDILRLSGKNQSTIIFALKKNSSSS